MTSIHSCKYSIFLSPLGSGPIKAPFARTLDSHTVVLVMIHLENPKSPLERDRANQNPSKISSGKHSPGFGESIARNCRGAPLDWQWGLLLSLHRAALELRRNGNTSLRTTRAHNRIFDNNRELRVVVSEGFVDCYHSMKCRLLSSSSKLNNKVVFLSKPTRICLP